MTAARDWIKPPQTVMLTFRISVEYAPAHAIVCTTHVANIQLCDVEPQRHVAGPYIYVSCQSCIDDAAAHNLQLTGEDSFEIAVKESGTHVWRFVIIVLRFNTHGASTLRGLPGRNFFLAWNLMERSILQF